MHVQPGKIAICIAALLAASTLFVHGTRAQSNQAASSAPAAAPVLAPTPVPVDQLPNRCGADVKLASAKAPAWASWGANPANWRYQNATQARLSVTDVPLLKLKWAFGIPNVKIVRSQPAIFRERVYVGGNDGTVYSLDAATGCAFWAITGKPVRSGLVIGKSGSADAAFYGDGSGGVYALDAVSGKFLWRTQADPHPAAAITGTPSYLDGRLYIPFSSGEEQSARSPGYDCCTFRGSVVAIDAANGKILWQTYMAAETPVPHGTTKDGHAIIGPSGMAIWSSPTLDVAKGRIYVGTGDNYSEPDTETSDAVVALDLRTGKMLWSAQFTKEKIFKIECNGEASANCVEPTVPEFDLGASPILVQLPRGKRVLLLGQKSGLVYAVNPDAEGKLLWHQRSGVGGLLGGVQWGPATDGVNAYVAVSDLAFLGRGPDPSKGGGITAYRLSDGKTIWKTPPPGCGDRRPCSPAQSQAVSAIPGAVFSGSIDGHLRAYATHDGRIIWDFDTARSFDGVNGVTAKGGSLDVGGPVIAGGMVVVVSGYAGFGAMPGNALLAFGRE